MHPDHLLALTFWTDFSRVRATLRYGQFPSANVQPSDWGQLGKLFAYIRGNTPQDAIVMTNLDPMFYLNTGRRTVRGFSPDGYKLYYAHSAPRSRRTSFSRPLPAAAWDTWR